MLESNTSSRFKKKKNLIIFANALLREEKILTRSSLLDTCLYCEQPLLQSTVIKQKQQLTISFS